MPKTNPTRQKKKEFENELKKLQKDEIYLKAIADIKDAEAQAVREAERAALTAKDDKKKGAKESSSKAEETKVAEKSEKATAAAMGEIDSALAASGKDAAAAKEQA